MNAQPKERAIPLKVGFATKTQRVELTRIQPLKLLPKTVKATSKWQEILASISEEGLVELPVVTRMPEKPGYYLLVDGHVRIEALRELGINEVDCLVTGSDDTYTYNTMVNRISAVQDHKMILKVLDSGVPAERLARALGRSTDTIRRRARLMDGVCEDAVHLLSDTPCSGSAIAVLKRMKPLRQIEAVELMVAGQNFSVPFAQALLAATPPDMLVTAGEKGARRKETAAALARVERELTKLQLKASTLSDSYGRDVVDLTLLKAHLTHLLANTAVVKWLARNRPEYLREFQKLTEVEDIGKA